MALYACNKEGWEKFMKERKFVEKGGLCSEREQINRFLDLVHFKNEGREEFIEFLASEGYISKCRV
jgi:hypothetical protein